MHFQWWEMLWKSHFGDEGTSLTCHIFCIYAHFKLGIPIRGDSTHYSARSHELVTGSRNCDITLSWDMCLSTKGASLNLAFYFDICGNKLEQPNSSCECYSHVAHTWLHLEIRHVAHLCHVTLQCLAKIDHENYLLTVVLTSFKECCTFHYVNVYGLYFCISAKLV